MRESKIEEDLCIWAKSQGIIVIKIATRGGAQRGVPDRVFLKDGKLCFIEMKRPGETPEPLQEWWLEKLCTEGFHATYCDDIDRGREYLRGVFGL